jgi:hypothetical protein
MATRAVARRQATSSGSEGASSVRAVGGEIADRDLVGMYLDEIARTPLLDAAKEVELSQTIEAGVYAQQILDGEVTDGNAAGADREELEALVAESAKAKDVFIRSNLRLVVAVARRYPRAGLPLLDLIQEGNAGLVRAVEKFDYAKGSARPSPAPSPTSPARSGCPCTSSRSWAGSAGCSASSTGRTAATRSRRRSPASWVPRPPVSPMSWTGPVTRSA